VTIRSNIECNYKYEELDEYRLYGSIYPDLLKDFQFCADNNLNQKVRTCPGDSGGPAIVRKFVDRRVQFTLMGIVSGGFGSGKDCSNDYGVPDFYTFVAHEEILPWIKEKSNAPGPWSEWSQCSVSCGKGQQSRTRNDGEKQLKECNLDPCPSWSPWSPCIAPCGPGHQTRSSSDGKIEVRPCQVQRCDADELILVSSEGDSADYLSDFMGLYKLMPQSHNNAPAYESLHTLPGKQQNYLYYQMNEDYYEANDDVPDESEDWWCVASVKMLGENTCVYSNLNTEDSSTLPQSGWEYWNGNWTVDPDLSFVAVTDISKLICPVVTIRASGKAVKKRSRMLGKFRLTGQFSLGRPIYVNKHDKYLFVHPDYLTWTVTDSLWDKRGHLKSASASGLCPSSARSTWNMKDEVYSWQYQFRNEWHEGDIIVTCDYQNIFC